MITPASVVKEMWSCGVRPSRSEIYFHSTANFM